MARSRRTAMGMPAYARPGPLALALILLIVGACGEEQASEDRPDSVTDSDLGTAVVCEDEKGDVQPLVQSKLDEVVSLAADLIETRMSVEGDSLLVEWAFADGASEALEDGGNQRMEVELEPVDGANPIVTLDVGRSPGGSPVVGISAITTRGPESTEDVDDVVVEAKGDTISMLVPTHLLHGVGNDRWRWSSTSTVGHADPSSGDQRMGQDACGSTDAGAGSKIIYFAGPALSKAEPPKEEAIVPMCERIPAVDDVEAIVGVDLGEPSGRYETECGYEGVDDPTDYALFSTFEQGERCTGSESIGELGDLPYELSGGIAGEVVICFPTEDLRVTTSIGSIDDDDGPLALEIAKLWLESLGP